MSAIPICMAMLANQAKKVMCQNVKRTRPSIGTPVQILSLATSQKLARDVTPSCGSTARADATNTRSIHGEATLENLAIFSKPRIASTVTTLPTSTTVTTQPRLLG